jgi:hypothetical protein
MLGAVQEGRRPGGVKRTPCLGLMIGLGIWLATGPSSAPAEVAGVEIASTCNGPCEPRLLPAAASGVVALWTDEGGATQAQLLEPRTGTRLGRAAMLGRIAADDVPAYAVDTPDGDVVLFGVLADGRVTFTRGSPISERRVGSRVLLPATASDVLGVAATTTPAGLAMVVLRGERDVPGERRASMEVELHEIGTKGEAGGPPRRWTSTSGYDPRIARCGDSLYLSWRSIPGTVVTAITAGERLPERMLPNDDLDELGPLACVSGGGRLFARSSSHPRQILIASLGPAGGPSPAWRAKQLPDPVRDMQLRGKRLYLFLDARDAGTTTVHVLDIETERLAALSLELPPLEPCAMLASEKAAVCGRTREVESSVQCRRVVNRVLVTWHGPAVSPSSETRPEGAVSAHATFFDDAAGITDPEAPSAKTLAARRSRLACGEPGWEPLRAALVSWCGTEARRRSRRAKPFCDEADPHSLLYQATNCTDIPLACGGTRRHAVLQVDRAQYDAGDDVEVGYLNCSVTFERRDGRWSVAGTDCVADL